MVSVRVVVDQQRATGRQKLHAGGDGKIALQAVIKNPLTDAACERVFLFVAGVRQGFDDDVIDREWRGDKGRCPDAKAEVCRRRGKVVDQQCVAARFGERVRPGNGIGVDVEHDFTAGRIQRRPDVVKIGVQPVVENSLANRPGDREWHRFERNHVAGLWCRRRDRRAAVEQVEQREFKIADARGRVAGDSQRVRAGAGQYDRAGLILVVAEEHLLVQRIAEFQPQRRKVRGHRRVQKHK